MVIRSAARPAPPGGVGRRSLFLGAAAWCTAAAAGCSPGAGASPASRTTPP
ncbi:hypothetical protein OV450_8147, partial [Actinobacteria bacterium OV450]